MISNVNTKDLIQYSIFVVYNPIVLSLNPETYLSNFIYNLAPIHSSISLYVLHDIGINSFKVRFLVFILYSSTDYLIMQQMILGG